LFLAKSPGGSAADRVIFNQVLTEMDLIRTQPNVIIIGATNRLDLIDSVIYLGRLDPCVFIPKVDENAHRKILTMDQMELQTAPQDVRIYIKKDKESFLYV
jgi:transitional endoplasmic reticulum ATPase